MLYPDRRATWSTPASRSVRKLRLSPYVRRRESLTVRALDTMLACRRTHASVNLESTMNMSRVVAIMAAPIAIAVAVVVAEGGQQNQSAGSAADRDEITAIVTRWETAWNTHDMTRLCLVCITRMVCGCCGLWRPIREESDPHRGVNQDDHAAECLADDARSRRRRVSRARDSDPRSARRRWYAPWRTSASSPSRTVSVLVLAPEADFASCKRRSSMCRVFFIQTIVP